MNGRAKGAAGRSGGGRGSQPEKGPQGGQQPGREHSVTLEDRARLSLTGVDDVDCFNEQLVVLRTPLGTLTVAGAGLNVSRLSLEDGRVEIDGEVDALEYSGGKKKSGGWRSRLFR